MNVDVKHVGAEPALLGALRNAGVLERTLISSQIPAVLDRTRSTVMAQQRLIDRILRARHRHGRSSRVRLEHHIRTLWRVRRNGPSEFAPLPGGGRAFSHDRRPGLADCAPSGRIRLDALARWLQDVAYADVEDAGVAQSAVWVVRRTRIRVSRFPRFGEHFTLCTYCSGIGKMWAERRTRVTRLGDGEIDVEAVSLWVHLDPDSGRPTPLSADEIATYGGAAAGRRVTARLRHEGPRAVKHRAPWRFRATERDLAGHVNNAAYWQPLEEELLAGADPQRIDVEIEFRTPSQPGDKLVLRDGDRRWIVGEDGETHASILVI